MVDLLVMAAQFFYHFGTYNDVQYYIHAVLFKAAPKFSWNSIWDTIYKSGKTDVNLSAIFDSINKSRRRLQNKIYFHKICGTARHDEVKTRKCEKRAELLGTPEHEQIKQQKREKACSNIFETPEHDKIKKLKCENVLLSFRNWFFFSFWSPTIMYGETTVVTWVAYLTRVWQSFVRCPPPQYVDRWKVVGRGVRVVSHTSLYFNFFAHTGNRTLVAWTAVQCLKSSKVNSSEAFSGVLMLLL